MVYRFGMWKVENVPSLKIFHLVVWCCSSLAPVLLRWLAWLELSLLFTIKRETQDSVDVIHSDAIKTVTVDFSQLFTEMFRTLFGILQVCCKVKKQVCKRRLGLATKERVANQKLSLQTSLWISLWTFETGNEFANFQMNFGAFGWKAIWNRL